MNLIDYANTVNAQHGKPPTPRGNWTDERIAALKRLWSEGYSASRIAALLGGISRSAVIGKVHRLNLSERRDSPNARRSAHLRRPRKRVLTPRRVIQAPTSRFAQYLAAASTAELPPPRSADTVGVTFAQIDADRPHQHCRWPVGDPKHPGFGFCGCAPVAGLPYCEAHARRAYTAPEPFRKTSLGYTFKTCVDGVRTELVHS